MVQIPDISVRLGLPERKVCERFNVVITGCVCCGSQFLMNADLETAHNYGLSNDLFVTPRYASLFDEDITVGNPREEENEHRQLD